MLHKVGEAGIDDFDPRTWAPDHHEYRIYLTDDLELYAVVDAVDYSPLVRVRWSSLGSKWKNGQKKNYARRNAHETLGPEGEKYESPITGKLVRNLQRIQRTIFLHHEVARLAGNNPPDPLEYPGIVWRLDHRDGNELNCRRKNLRWATQAFNVANKNGRLADVDPLEWHRMMSLKGDINANT